MPESAVAETTVAAIVNAPQNQPKADKAPARGARADAVVVTGENFNEFVAKQMNPGAEQAADAKPANDSPEAKAAEELKALEAAKAKASEPKEGDKRPGEVFFKGEWVKRDSVNYRMHVKTEAARVAEEKAGREAAARVAAEQAAQAAKAEAEALRAKYEPKRDELGPEPQPEQFTDTAEYAKALKEWTKEATEREISAKAAKEAQERERRAQAEAWEKRVADAKKAVPDYDKRLSESKVMVSDQMRDAILESEVGPQILLHLAEHPEEALELGKMTVGRMLRAMGKLEAALAKAPAGKASDDDAAPQHRAADVGRAAVAAVSAEDAPISPIGGVADSVVRLNGHQEVPRSMTYDDWKKLRQSGKIK